MTELSVWSADWFILHVLAPFIAAALIGAGASSTQFAMRICRGLELLQCISALGLMAIQWAPSAQPVTLAIQWSWPRVSGGDPGPDIAWRMPAELALWWLALPATSWLARTAWSVERFNGSAVGDHGFRSHRPAGNVIRTQVIRALCLWGFLGLLLVADDVCSLGVGVLGAGAMWGLAFSSSGAVRPFETASRWLRAQGGGVLLLLTGVSGMLSLAALAMAAPSGSPRLRLAPLSLIAHDWWERQGVHPAAAALWDQLQAWPVWLLLLGGAWLSGLLPLQGAAQAALDQAPLGQRAWLVTALRFFWLAIVHQWDNWIRSPVWIEVLLIGVALGTFQAAMRLWRRHVGMAPRNGSLWSGAVLWSQQLSCLAWVATSGAPPGWRSIALTGLWLGQWAALQGWVAEEISAEASEKVQSVSQVGGLSTAPRPAVWGLCWLPLPLGGILLWRLGAAVTPPGLLGGGVWLACAAAHLLALLSLWPRNGAAAPPPASVFLARGFWGAAIGIQLLAAALLGRWGFDALLAPVRQ